MLTRDKIGNLFVICFIFYVRRFLYVTLSQMCYDAMNFRTFSFHGDLPIYLCYYIFRCLGFYPHEITFPCKLYKFKSISTASIDGTDENNLPLITTGRQHRKVPTFYIIFPRFTQTLILFYLWWNWRHHRKTLYSYTYKT